MPVLPVADLQLSRCHTCALEAKRLLHFSTLSVKEIAFQLGFADFGYFGRLFKRHTGITPTEYRQRVGIVLLG